MPLPTHNLTILPEWIDYNGHMNVAYYVMAFDLATDELYEAWGLGLDYLNQVNASVFTLGMNVDYLSELFAGDAIHISTQLLDVDAKRIHYFHQMFQTKTGVLAATNECLCINVDLETRRSTPFPTPIQQRLMTILAEHGQMPLPPQVGRKLAIRRQ